MIVEILKEGAEYVAWDEDVLEMGFGSSPDEARADLAANIRDKHQWLNECGSDRLGADLARVLEILNGRKSDG